MSRERYLLQRDDAQSRREIRESEERAAKSRSGINTSRGIGRALGTLAGLALAPATGGASLLAMAGGLGSLGGSFVGSAVGKHRYGGPEKADIGLFNRDVAKEQRKGVDQYWKGLKEQTVTNALQDAVTAGMYGSQIKSGMNELKFKLGGGYKGMAPTGAAPLQQANTAGMIPDYHQQQLAKYLEPVTGSTTGGPIAGDAGAGVGGGLVGGGGGGSAGQGMNNWIENLGKDGSFFEWMKNLGKKPEPVKWGNYANYATDPSIRYGTGPNFLQDAVANTGYTGSAAQNMQLIDHYNQTTPIQYNSAVDMLKAQGQESSFDARTNLWNQLSQMGVK